MVNSLYVPNIINYLSNENSATKSIDKSVSAPVPVAASGAHGWLLKVQYGTIDKMADRMD